MKAKKKQKKSKNNKKIQYSYKYSAITNAKQVKNTIGNKTLYYISTDLCAFVLCGTDESYVQVKGKRGNLHWVAD